MASTLLLEVTDATFSKQILSSPIPVLVDFWSTTCAPCRAILPHLEALASQYAGRASVAKCNIDENQGAPAQFEVRSMPTLLMFKNGQVTGQLVGAAPRAKIEELIKKAL